MKRLFFGKFKLSMFLLVLIFNFIDAKISELDLKDFTSAHEVLNYSKEPSFRLDELSSYEDIVSAAVIGGGCGGLAAAIYLARSNLQPMIFQGEKPGGQLMDTSFVENIPGVKRQYGSEIIDTMTEQALNFGATIVEDSIVEVDFSDPNKPYKLKTSSGKTIQALVVVIATGSSSRKLGIPGEDQYWGRGVAVCALCDCTLFRDLDVAIIGGGDASVSEASLLAEYASSVTIFVRKDRMRAADKIQDSIAGNPKIKVVYNKELVEIIGDGQCVTGIKYKDLESKNPQEIITKPLSGVFLAIGNNPNSKLFGDFLALNNNGYIIADRHQETSVPRVFVAGDVSDAIFRQAVIATATGTIAGLNGASLLKNGGFSAANLKTIEHKFYMPTKKVTLNSNAKNN